MEHIRTIDRFMNPQQVMELQTYFEKNVSWYFGSQSDREAMPFGHWNFDFLQSDPRNEKNLEDVLKENPQYKIISDLWLKIKNELRPGHKLVRCYANAHTFGVEGYPHVDSRKPGHYTSLVYVNPFWSLEWAGETVFINDLGDIIHSSIPKAGRVCLFDGRIIHAARAVTRRCPALRVTLVFKSSAPDNSQSAIDDNLKKYLLENGASEVNHSGYSLFDHLEGTYRILEKAKLPLHVCVAGLFHSVYGTVPMTHVTIAHDRRNEVKALIGEKAEALAWAFCQLDRPSLLENALETGDYKCMSGWSAAGEEKTFFEEMVQIEIANLIEQKSLYRFPNLSEKAKNSTFLDQYGLHI